MVDDAGMGGLPLYLQPNPGEGRLKIFAPSGTTLLQCMFLQIPDPSVRIVMTILLAALAFDLLLVAFAWKVPVPRSADRSETYQPPADERDGDHRSRRGQTSVRCPECETPNEPGYSYCRECISELPGGATRGRQRSPPFGRFVQ